MKMKYVRAESGSQRKILRPGMTRRVAHLNNIMVAVIDVEEPMEEPDPPHSHPHEQITYVAEGDLWFIIGIERYRLQKGDLIVIPAEEPHTIQTISRDVRLIDSFSPVREDFL
jgi:quercetin dioxygenase-like cupin family protein